MIAEPFDTVGDLIHHLREQWGGHRELVRTRSPKGAHSLSSKELIADTHALALSLDRMGAKPGQRLALLSENRPGWIVTDLASHLLGLVTVPIDPRMPADQVGFILRNSGASFLVFGGQRERALLDRVLAGLRPTPTLISMEVEAAYPGGHALTPLVGQGAERLLETSLDALRGRVGGDDPASLTYSSGATGDPKGVLLSHRNLTFGIEGLAQRLQLRPYDRALSLMPWAHPLERLAVYAHLKSGVTVVSPPTGLDPRLALEREQPHVFVAPPGLLERVQGEVLEGIERSSPLRRALFGQALRRATPRTEEGLRPRAPLARRFLGPIRRALGGRVKVILSGFAPLSSSSEGFFLAAGIDLCVGYGLVEAGGLVTVTRRHHRTLGTVGRPLSGYRLETDRDGEIRVSGPGVMLHYWQRGESAGKEPETDGWLLTGDLGRLDRRGRLHVLARRTSRLTLASGEIIAPHPIEQRLQTSPWIDRAVVIGGGRSELGALIVAAHRRPAEPQGADVVLSDEVALEPRSPEALPPGRTPSALEQAAATVPEEPILAEIQRLNQGLPVTQRIRRFHLLPRPLSIASGELTRNGQLRRRAIADLWGDEIAALWAAERAGPGD